MTSATSSSGAPQHDDVGPHAHLERRTLDADAPRRNGADGIEQPGVVDEARLARDAQLAQQRTVGGEQRVAAEQHVDARREQRGRRGAAEQEAIGARTPHDARIALAQQRDSRVVHADGVHGEEIARQQTAHGERMHLRRRLGVDTLGEMDGEW